MQFTSYDRKSFRPNGSGFKKDHHKNQALVVIRVFPHSLELRLHLRRNSCPRICNHLLATKEETRKNIAIRQPKHILIRIIYPDQHRVFKNHKEDHVVQELSVTG